MRKVQRPSREGVGPKWAPSAGHLVWKLTTDKPCHTRGAMWSRSYSECVGCGRTDRPHMAKGQCASCYQQRYAADPANLGKIKSAKQRHYLKAGGASAQKVAREQRWFSGSRDAVLERDGHQCVRCGNANLASLVVHHKDGNGRGQPQPNNDLSNLETLCRKCHAAEHSSCASWARGYDQCIGCGTTGRKHNAKGLCWLCYSKVPR